MPRKPSTPPLEAIPTEYAGIQFRSRHEADLAKYFDDCNLGWEYEKRSFLLPSGIHYMPDFYLPAVHLWVEARGYHTPKADSQITDFPAVMPDGDAFVVFWREDGGRRFQMIADTKQYFTREVQESASHLVRCWAWEIVAAMSAYYAQGTL